MLKKLKKQNGETLIESLVSVLICVMAMTMLAGSMVASARINHTNREADKKYEEDLKSAEVCDTQAEASSEKVQFIIKHEDSTTEIIEEDIILYDNGTESSFASYKSNSITEP